MEKSIQIEVHHERRDTDTQRERCLLIALKLPWYFMVPGLFLVENNSGHDSKEN